LLYFRDEELLGLGLALNDSLQRVLLQHDNIAKGTANSGARGVETPVLPLVHVNHEDDESEDDFGQLAHRWTQKFSCYIKMNAVYSCFILLFLLGFVVVVILM